MTPERWQQIKAAFDQIRELSNDQRANRLAELHARDSEMHRDVVALLESDHAASEFLEHPPLTEIGRIIDPPAGLPSRIGPYRIVREIGRGGMGVVLLGSRDDETYQKDVAIKVMRAGADDGLLRRFTDERRILAQLTHPNIAVLLDGGTTERGEPFLVMEYIDGKPIDAHCDAAALSINDRLRLFLLVCDAVQHAHQRLVVHRDIKPANIVVTGEGVPKLLDFGIAKLLADGAGPGATVTVAQLLTPEYASPEQIRGEAITVATDVYALGVVLYRLLTGTRPYATTTDRPHELARAICEDDPARPSSRRRMAGDLDTIVLKALQKNPERRYSSVEAFAADITRYLEGRPVLAHADSMTYRATKFVRRHRAAVAAAAALVLAIGAGSVTTAWQWRVADAERAVAQRRFNDVRQLANSFLFEIHDAIQDLPGATPARKLLATRALEYLDNLARESDDNPALQRDLAIAYDKVAAVLGKPNTASLGDYKTALTTYRKAQAISDALLARDAHNAELLHQDSARSLVTTLLLAYGGEVPAAVQEAGKGAAIEEKLSSLDHSAEQSLRLGRSYGLHGWILAASGNTTDGLDRLRRAIALLEPLTAPSVLTEAQAELALSHHRLGETLEGAAPVPGVVPDLNGAHTAYAASLAIEQQLLDAQPLNTLRRRRVAIGHQFVGGTLERSGDAAGAIDQYRRGVPLAESIAAADPANADAQAVLAAAYAKIGRLEARTGATESGMKWLHKALATVKPLTGTSNINYRGAIADAHEGLGYAHCALAADRRAPQTVRRQHADEGKKWLEQSAAFWTKMRDSGATTGYEAEIPDRIAREIERCAAAR